jgi:DNA-nicking Smr family endonuclease
MSPRKPTAEELRLWRESNRFTTVKEGFGIGDSGLEEEAAALNTPATEPIKTPLSFQSPIPNPGSPLKPLTGREATRVLKSASAAEARLDLHGLSKTEAYIRVRSFLHESVRRGLRHVAIITGKGRTGDGVLRRELPHWLNEPALRPLLSALAYAPQEKGGSGVLHVLVKRKR